MSTIQTLAAELYTALIEKTRDDGSAFVTLEDDSPDWMGDAVRAAHGDFMPDDWRYQAIKGVCSHRSDSDSFASEDIDSLVDCYTGRLTAWLATSVKRVGYCDEAESEYGPAKDMSARLMAGQRMEYSEIWYSLIHYLEGLAAFED